MIGGAIHDGSDKGGGRPSATGPGGAPLSAAEQAKRAKDDEELALAGDDGSSDRHPARQGRRRDGQARHDGLLDTASASNDLPTPLLLALIALGGARADRRARRAAQPHPCARAACRCCPRSRPRVLRSHAPRVAEVVLGGALAGVAFGAAGGSELGRTTTVEVLLVIVCGAFVAAAIAWGGPGKLYGAVCVPLFAALAAFTALSVTWAMVPSLAYVEAGRTLAYLASSPRRSPAARLAPRATPAVVTGIVLAATAAVLYALAARIWPGSIGENEISNRIGQPFQYWNAVGTTAALAIPGLLWLGDAPRRPPCRPRPRLPGAGRRDPRPAADPVARRAGGGDRSARRSGSRSSRVRLRSLPLIVLPSARRRRRRGLGAVEGRLLGRRRAAARQGERGRRVRAAGAC